MRGTFCARSPRVFGVRKSSLVFRKALLALYTYLVTKTRNQETRNQISAKSSDHFQKNRQNFEDFFEKNHQKFFEAFFWKSVLCIFARGLERAKTGCFVNTGHPEVDLQPHWKAVLPNFDRVFDENRFVLLTRNLVSGFLVSGFRDQIHGDLDRSFSEN